LLFHIRFQISGSAYFYSAYWPSGSFGGYGSPGSECGTASISMALSYIGINKTPKTILETNNGYTYFDGWGVTTSSPSVANGMSNYINGNGKYSPLIIHLPNYSAAGHWVILASQVSGNVYQVLDPANAVMWDITVNGNSATYAKDGYTIYDTIDRTYQYYNENASITGDYLSQCTAYPTYCDITITDSGAYVKSLPCSESTDSKSENVEHPSVGTLYTATKLYVNSSGNYWYKVIAKNGKDGYVYAGDCELTYSYVDLNISGVNAPTQLTAGSVFSIGGTISSEYNRISAVSAYVYPADSDESSALTGTSVSIDTASYSLNGSEVDKGVRFNDLGVGTYSYVVRATAYGYVATGPKTAIMYSSSEKLHTSTFAIVNETSSDDSAVDVEMYRPGKPVLTGTQSIYDEKMPIVFNWESTSNTTHYNLFIDRLETSGNYERLENIHYASSGISRTLTRGTYRVLVQSTNANYWETNGSNWLFQNSDWHYFSVEHLHQYNSFVTEATCTEQGYTIYVCSECDDSYTSNDTEPLGHAWNSGAVTLQPTATQNGLKTYTCTRCWETKTEEIPATGVQTPCNGGSSCPSEKFKDVNASHWFHESVDFAVSQGLFGGMSDTTFAPNTAMTRAMLVTVLWRYAGQPAEGVNNFTDVANNQWYTNAVAWAANSGVVTGVGNNKFNPNGKITREQMAAILYRYANGRGIDTSARADLSSFPDGNKVSSYAKDAIRWTVAEGLINGADGKLMPQGNATRAQVATILMRFINNMKS